MMCPKLELGARFKRRPGRCKKLDLIDKCDKRELGVTTRDKASNIHDESHFFFEASFGQDHHKAIWKKMNGSSIEIIR